MQGFGICLALISDGLQTQQCGAFLTSSGSHCCHCNRETRDEQMTDGTMVKKVTYSIIGIFLLLISGSMLSGALELHVISDHIQHFNSFPESAWLIVLGSLLISGATFLRRR